MRGFVLGRRAKPVVPLDSAKVSAGGPECCRLLIGPVSGTHRASSGH